MWRAMENLLSRAKQLWNIIFSRKEKGSEERNLTHIVLRSSAISLAVRVITVILGLVTMPIVYNSLDKYQYGIFVTLTSIIGWIDMFDFGIANGLRNKLTEARTDNDVSRGRMYISSAYCMLFGIAGIVFIAYCIAKPFLNWQVLLNAASVERKTLDSMAFWVLTFFLIRFGASVINNVYDAFQKAYVGSLIAMIGKVVYLIAIIGYVKLGDLDLFRVAVLQSGLSALMPVLAAIYFFCFENPVYRPSIKLINLGQAKDILSLGWKFFVIQLALLVIHSGNNLLISHFVDPSSVAGYSLSYQLFSYMLLAYSIVLGPLWPAYTEAWKRGDEAWIIKTINRMKSLYSFFAIASVVVVFISPWFFRIWIGEKADVPILMTTAVAVMFLLDMWIRIFDFFINGIGKIQVQMIVNVAMAFINVPMAYLLAVVCDFGALGVVLASILSYGVMAVISPLQASMLLNHTAKGVWNK
jgi:O-antigen/teichoic acid export membrane protein